MLARARNSVFWPGMTKQIKTLCASCKSCRENSPSQTKEPLIVTGPPEYPFEKVASDLFTENQAWYMAFACRLTGWLEIAFFPTSTRSGEIIRIFRDLFQRFGIPEEISLDGASNLKSGETLSFLDSWGVVRRLSAAYYPQSNGRAEAAVRTAKRITRTNTGPKGNLNTDAVSKALMQYRNTPIKGVGASPAQLMLGRSIRDSVPQPRSSYKVSPKWETMLRQREKAMSRSADSLSEETAGRSTHAELSIGTEVLLQNADSKKWDRSGLIIEACEHRQYKVRVHGSGRVTLRNRIHLRPLLVFKPATGPPRLPGQRSPSTSGGPSSTHPSIQTSSNTHPTQPSVTHTESFHTPSSPSYQPSSYQPSSYQPSSYQPSSSSDVSSHVTARSRSPLLARRDARPRTEPDRYGDWVPH